MADGQGVLVAGEVAGGQLQDSTKELLAHGRKLADALGESLSVALLGQDLGDLPKEAIAFGADKVYATTNPLLDGTHPEADLAALTKLAQDNAPRVILVAKSPLGVEIGPRLAFRLGTGLAQDCMEVNVDDQQRLTANRPVFGGNCMATVVCTGSPSMAVIRGKTTDPLERDDSRQGEVEAVSPGIDASIIKYQVLETVTEEREGIRLEDASIVISGGRGLGGPEPFENELKELADLLGAAMGASRAAVDIGWVPYSYQIGLTGKSIAPDLYITIGISGASQHMAGCSGARVVVAINRDLNANIFQEASYGVAAEWQKVLPAFIQQVRELQ